MRPMKLFVLAPRLGRTETCQPPLVRAAEDRTGPLLLRTAQHSLTHSHPCARSPCARGPPHPVAVAEAIVDGIRLSANIPVDLIITEHSGHAAEVVGNQRLSVDPDEPDGDDVLDGDSEYDDQDDDVFKGRGAGACLRVLIVVCGGDGTVSEVIDAARCVGLGAPPRLCFTTSPHSFNNIVTHAY